MVKKLVITGAIILTLFVVYVVLSGEAEAPADNNYPNTTVPVSDSSSATYTIDKQDSIYFIANKNRPIMLQYEPLGLVKPNVALIPDDNPEEQQLRTEAARAVEQMFKDAQSLDYKLIMASGYRSADLQKFYYENYVKADGQEAADKFSARPGHSEHQTGLAVDISRTDRKCYLMECFSDTVEGIWLADNAHKYGFILRYPQGKESITKYQFEPWHFRYVGESLATKLFESKQTLEEFFNLN